MATKPQKDARKKVRRGVRPKTMQEMEFDESVLVLVEPDGDDRTYYGPVIQAMANRLNCWQMTGNAKVEDARETLRTALQQIEAMANNLDRLVGAANAD